FALPSWAGPSEHCPPLSPRAAATASSVITPFDAVPDFAEVPTIASSRSGSWSDPNTWNPARLPTATDTVKISHVVTVNSTAAVARMGGGEASGALTFDPNASTRLTVGPLLVKPGGSLEVGTAATPVAADKTAEVVIADQPLNLTTDPNQYG